MNVLSTPHDRFEGLSEYPFSQYYATIQDRDMGALKMHYVDEGPRTGEVLLLLHGEPSWSYLYRHMILALSRDYRVMIKYTKK